jgi:hypothetical protein
VSIEILWPVDVRGGPVEIEALRPGDAVVTLDEGDPARPAHRGAVEEVFARTAYTLQILTIRSSSGKVQTLRTTNEHPVFVPGRGWIKAAGFLPEG